MKTIILIFSSFLVLSAHEKNADSLIDHENSTLVINAGVGAGFYNLFYDFGAKYKKNNSIYGLRYFTSREVVYELAFAGNPGFNRPLENIWEVDAFIGKEYYDKGFTASFLTGLSIVGGTIRGKLLHEYDSYSPYNEYEYLDNTVIGIPLEARISYSTLQYIDIGVSGFININQKGIIKSLTLSVQFMLPM
jgi:hypothetical protein